MKVELNGLRAVVCGGSSGIGKACSKLLANNGASITIISRSKNKLNNIVSNLDRSKDQSHKFICADLNEPNRLDEILKDKLDYKVDILINNSGGPKGGLLIDAEPTEFTLAFNRLLVSSQILTKFVVSDMQKQGFGRIINIISTSINQVIPGLGVSNTVRGAVSQWSKTLAIELGSYNITVNNILPGYTKTKRLEELATSKAQELNTTKDNIYKLWADSTSLKRLAEPNEIANTVLFLCSGGSSYITGHNLSVDGGRYKT